MMKVFAAVLCTITIVASGLYAAADETLENGTKFSVRGTDLLMSGVINSQTLDQFEAVITAHPNIDRLVELVVLGSEDDATMIALAYRVRQLGLDTHLTAKSEVYSGGVDLFIAGVKRSIEMGAVVGVHSWSDGEREATDFPLGAEEHEANRRYIEDMLGKDDFYWFTIFAAPADDIHIMTDPEILRFGLITK